MAIKTAGFFSKLTFGLTDKVRRNFARPHTTSSQDSPSTSSTSPATEVKPQSPEEAATVLKPTVAPPPKTVYEAKSEPERQPTQNELYQQTYGQEQADSSTNTASSTPEAPVYETSSRTVEQPTPESGTFRTTEDLEPAIPSFSRPRPLTGFQISSGDESSSPLPRERSASERTRDLKLYLAARGQTDQEKFFEDIRVGLFSILPIPQSLKPQRSSSETALQMALDQALADNPEVYTEEEKRKFKEALPQLSQATEEELGGVVRQARFIPPPRLAEEGRYLSARDRLFSIGSTPQGLLSFAQQSFMPSIPLPSPVSSAVKATTESALKTAGTQGLVGAKGLIGGLGRLAGSGGLRAALAGAKFIPYLGWATAILDPKIIKFAIILPFAAILLVGVVGISSPQGAFVTAGGAGDLLRKGSQYIDIEIQSSSSTLKNDDLPKTVNYKVVVKPKKNPLQNPRVQVNVVANGNYGSRTLKTESWSDLEKEFSVDLGSDLQDSAITLSVVAEATVSEQTDRQTAVATHVVRVGTPPEDCPSGWPTPYGNITIGPNSSTYYTHHTAEAIDIGNGPKGQIKAAPVMATHKGRVSFNCFDSNYGICVRLETTCNGKLVYTIYAHLMVRSSGIQEGQVVSAGTELGRVGATGNTAGADPNHLHYEFLKISGQKTIPMSPPYIPKAPIEGRTWWPD